MYEGVHRETLSVGREVHETANPPMHKHENLSRTQWECLYHVVFIPKCRRRALYVELRKYLVDVFAGWRNRSKAASNGVT